MVFEGEFGAYLELSFVTSLPQGCEDQLYEYLSSNLLLIGGLALAVSFIELFGLCGAFMLRRAILHGY